MKNQSTLWNFFSTSLVLLLCSAAAVLAQSSMGPSLLESTKSSAHQHYSNISQYNNSSVNQTIQEDESENALADTGLLQMGSANSLSVDSANWMGRLPDSILLRDINLPGTHDSASIDKYYDTWLKRNPKFYAPYLVYTLAARHYYDRQSCTITDQLERGIRLLDVRLKSARKIKSTILLHVMETNFQQ